MQRKHTLLVLLALALIIVVAAGCSSAKAPTPAPVPTKTPRPTFTPTIAVTPTRLLIPTATPAAAQAPAATADPAKAAPTSAPQAPAQPATPEIAAGQTVNVRQGPGTNYPVIGQLQAGESFKVTARNSDGTWLQFNYKGDLGWASTTLVSFSGDPNSVKVAQNIPVAPTQPPAPTAAPVPVVVQQPAQPPAPTAVPQPVSQFKYKVARVASCRPQAGGTWFDGSVTMGGQPIDGERVVFSWAPDGAVIAAQTSGPHSGYPGWNHGYFSHIVNDQPGRSRVGDWYIWVTDANGGRISEIAKWHSDGPVPEGTGCNDATIAFEG